jgi:hypothetical protein
VASGGKPTQQAPSNPSNPYQMISRPDYKAPTAPSSLGQASQYSHSISLQISDPDTFFTDPVENDYRVKGRSVPDFRDDGGERGLISGLQPQPGNPSYFQRLSPKIFKLNRCKIKSKSNIISKDKITNINISIKIKIKPQTRSSPAAI